MSDELPLRAAPQTGGPPASSRPVRRVITGHDSDGRSVILSDGPTPHHNAPAGMPAMVARVVWMTDAIPSASGEIDRAPTELIPPFAPSPGATILRIVDFPPDRDYADTDMEQMFREIGGAEAHEAGHGNGNARHFWFHKTQSLDYAIVLDGEIWALLDEGETRLTAGDVLVQCATNHAWANRSDRSCRVAFVLIGTEDHDA